MILGGVLVFISQIYVGFFKNAPGIAAIFGVFGSLVVAVGFIVLKWENGWLGNTNRSEGKKPYSSGDSAIAIIPPPRRLPVFDPDTGRRLCSFYFYDVDNRLPCLSGCEYPNAKHGACCREHAIPTCPYPKSREPLVNSLMPKPVAWCPGPGGCKHFNELEYVCNLKLKGLQKEFLFTFSRKTQNKNIGTILIISGIIPLLIPVLSLIFNFSSDVQALALLPGVFVGTIGLVVYNHAE